MPTPWGSLYISASESGIHSVVFADAQKDYPSPLLPYSKQAKQEIGEFLAGKRQKFTLPLLLEASGFSLDVLEALGKVPYGSVVTYSELALLAKRPRAARAVGNVMNKNPLCLLLPCHRIIASGGKLGGFGYNIHIKKDLLALEGHTTHFQE